jgi:hypothetical protein
VAVKVRKRLAINKKSAQNFAVERFNLRKLSDLDFRKQYQMKISNRFAALENLNNSENIILAWETSSRIFKLQPKRVLVYMKRSSINHILTNKIYEFRPQETG